MGRSMYACWGAGLLLALLFFAVATSWDTDVEGLRQNARKRLGERVDEFPDPGSDPPGTFEAVWRACGDLTLDSAHCRLEMALQHPEEVHMRFVAWNAARTLRDEDLVYDFELAWGRLDVYGPKSTGQMLNQRWGRLLAQYAPRPQRRLVRAAAALGDHPLAAVLGTIGGSMACHVDGADFVVCIP